VDGQQFAVPSADQRGQQHMSVDGEFHGAPFRHDSKSDWTSFSDTPLALSRRPISALNFSNSSRFKSTRSAPSGEREKTPAIRPRRVMRIGSLDRGNPVALSRNSGTVLILMWSLW